VAAEDRASVIAIRAEPDPVRKLELYARSVAEAQARLAPLFVALRDASSTEADARAVWTEISQRRAANMRKLVQDVSDAAGGLRPGLTVDEAADVVWATNGSEMYVLLVVERGWSGEKYRAFLADTWCRLLLPDQGVPTRSGRGE
jgi:hypothetical protein